MSTNSSLFTGHGRQQVVLVSTHENEPVPFSSITTNEISERFEIDPRLIKMMHESKMRKMNERREKLRTCQVNMTEIESVYTSIDDSDELRCQNEGEGESERERNRYILSSLQQYSCPSVVYDSVAKRMHMSKMISHHLSMKHPLHIMIRIYS